LKESSAKPLSEFNPVGISIATFIEFNLLRYLTIERYGSRRLPLLPLPSNASQTILQSLNENARTIRLPVNVVQELHKAKKELDANGIELPEKFHNLPTTIDLDSPVNEEGDTLLDMLTNPDADNPETIFSTEGKLKDKLMGIMDVLDERERVIVEDYFGLSGSTRTLEDIGNDFDLTKERVRQIKEKALRKLRNETGTLFDYL